MTGVLVRVVLLLCINVLSCTMVKYQNNVCRTFEDYATLNSNPNCWYNPDADSNPRLIAKRYGYPFEKHTVKTDDGYILNVYRISNNNTSTRDKKQPILIHHGIGGVSVFWMLQGRNSAAFVLAENGYDVWLANARGTYYSPQHEKYTMNDPQFWNFGMQEIAMLDLPATIEYISKTTGQKGNLVYIGHSMGTTISYIYATDHKRHAEENLRGIISLSPVAYMKNVKGAFRDLSPLTPFSGIVDNIGIKVLGQFHDLQKNILKATCGTYPLILACTSLLIYSSGYASRQQQPEIIPIFLSYYPSAMSFKILKQYGQIISNGGVFRKYDYGSPENMKLYGQAEPPEYDVSNISVPVHFFVGTEDFAATERDVDIFMGKMNSPNTTTKAWKYSFDYAHNDFFLAKYLDPFYKVLLSTLKSKLEPT